MLLIKFPRVQKIVKASQKCIIFGLISVRTWVQAQLDPAQNHECFIGYRKKLSALAPPPFRAAKVRVIQFIVLAEPSLCGPDVIRDIPSQVDDPCLPELRNLYNARHQCRDGRCPNSGDNSRQK